MFTQKLLEFKKRHNIPSADKWAEESGVSKSTIIRALKGDCKDMKVYTLDALLKPYGGSIDELLGIGYYSPEAIEKEELKNEIVEKIETVIDVIQNSEDLPEQPTEEIKTALVEVQEYIENEPSEHTKCVGCDTLREMIMELKGQINYFKEPLPDLKDKVQNIPQAVENIGTSLSPCSPITYA